MRPQEEKSWIWSGKNPERKRLAKHPEEVGYVFLRKVLHGEVKIAS